MVMDRAKLLGENLRARRGTMTQEAFAKRLGISRATLNRLENACQNITIATLDQIATALKCDVGDLFKEV